MMTRGSRGRRIALLTIYSIATLSAFAGTVILALTVWLSHATLDDRLALTGDVITAGTLLLAVIAAFVALQAFAVSTGLPKLQVQLWFDSSNKNRPLFLADELRNGWLQTSTPSSQTHGRIRLRNHSSYPARDISINIRLNGMVVRQEDFRDKEDWWGVDTADDIGITAVQWDGGSEYLIHGHSARRLPDLDLGQILLIGDPGNSFFEVQVIASPGYRREVRIPVVFLREGNASFSRLEQADGISSSEWL